MLNFLQKIIFWLKKPKVIIVVGTEKKEKASEIIYQILNQYFLKEKIILNKNIGFSFLFKNKILIFNSKIEKIEKLKFLIKQSSLPILVLENFDEIEEQIIKIKGLISSDGYLILNLDNRINKKLKEKIKSNCLTFGFQAGADIQVSDIKTDNNKINFKINYQGNIVPIWLENFNKKQIYSILASIGIALIFNFNLVEISQNFKYRQ